MCLFDGCVPPDHDLVLDATPILVPMCMRGSYLTLQPSVSGASRAANLHQCTILQLPSLVYVIFPDTSMSHRSGVHASTQVQPTVPKLPELTRLQGYCLASREVVDSGCLFHLIANGQLTGNQLRWFRVCGCVGQKTNPKTMVLH